MVHARVHTRVHTRVSMHVFRKVWGLSDVSHSVSNDIMRGDCQGVEGCNSFSLRECVAVVRDVECIVPESCTPRVWGLWLLYVKQDVCIRTQKIALVRVAWPGLAWQTCSAVSFTKCCAMNGH